MLPDIHFDFVKLASQMFIIDYIVSVTLVNNNLSCTTAGPGLVITVWWSLSGSCTTLDRLMT